MSEQVTAYNGLKNQENQKICFNDITFRGLSIIKFPKSFDFARKSCCKVCCQEKLCSGCSKMDCECKNGPIRGNYDGLVVLACVTKDTTPRYIQ